jgi:hypothetical protein
MPELPCTELIYHESWRSADWDPDVESRPGWQVKCSEHGLLGKGWAYALKASAKQTAARHEIARHGRPKRHG